MQLVRFGITLRTFGE